MFDSFTSKLFCYKKDVTTESGVSRANECGFHNLPKFWSGQCIDHYIMVFPVQIPTSFHPDAQLMKWDCFWIRKWPWLVSTQYVDFDYLLTPVLPIHFLLTVAGISFISDCADEPIIVSSYMGFNGRSSISGFGPSKVSRNIFSFASSANLYCTLHFSQPRGGSGVGLSHEAPFSSGVRLFAGCAMSYTIWIRQSLAMRVSLLLSKVRFAEGDPNLVSFCLLAVWDTKREEQLILK